MRSLLTWAGASTTISVPAVAIPSSVKIVILYRIQEGDVLILHVVRGSSNLEALFDQ